MIAKLLIAAPVLGFLMMGSTGALGPRAVPDLPSLPLLPSAETVEEPVLPAPVTISIPAIGVDALVEIRGKTPEGDMEAPHAWENVSWYAPGPAPGERGRAAFAGHLDSTTGPAVFWRMEALAPGDVILVQDAAETFRRFRVTRLEAYDALTAPLQDIFQGGDARELILITCDGQWNDATGNYDRRLVVYASLDDDASSSSSSSAYTTVRSS